MILLEKMSLKRTCAMFCLTLRNEEFKAAFVEGWWAADVSYNFCLKKESSFFAVLTAIYPKWVDHDFIVDIYIIRNNSWTILKWDLHSREYSFLYISKAIWGIDFWNRNACKIQASEYLLLGYLVMLMLKIPVHLFIFY